MYRTIPILLITACSHNFYPAEKHIEPEEHQNSNDPNFIDEDGDGFVASEDCDDSNAQINPNANEQCDEIDNDCDGEIDEDSSNAITWYIDADNDGFGSDAETLKSCEPPEGYSSDQTDCDDENHFIYPDAMEICDGFDNNCDGFVTHHEFDNDGDGFVSCSLHTNASIATEIAGGDDCNDQDDSVHPQAAEICDGIDNNCDEEIHLNEVDNDGDGFIACPASDDVTFHLPPGDCDDSNSLINPTAIEICDSIDNDCDELVDDLDDNLDISTTNFYWRDEDGDGYGGNTDVIQQCHPIENYVDNNSDCNDFEFLINPGATEICDGLDNTCSGSLDAEANLYTKIGQNNGIASSFTGTLSGFTQIDLTSDYNELHFCSGTHQVNIDIYSDAMIYGHSNGSTLPVLTGNGQGTVIALQSTQLNVGIQEVTIEDGIGDMTTVIDGETFNQLGGGVYCEGSQVILNTVNVSQNDAEKGGGIFAKNCVIHLYDAEIKSNTSTSQGGGMWLGDDSDIQIFDATIAENSTGGLYTLHAKGGGIYATQSRISHSEDLIIDDNSAHGLVTGYGGGAFFNGQEFNLEGNTSIGQQNNGGFSKNYASTAGGALALIDAEFSGTISDFGFGPSENEPDDIAIYTSETGLNFWDIHNYMNDIGNLYCYSLKSQGGTNYSSNCSN